MGENLQNGQEFMISVFIPKKLSFSFNNCHLYQKYTHYYHTNLKFLKLTTKKKFLTDWSKRKVPVVKLLNDMIHATTT